MRSKIMMQLQNRKQNVFYSIVKIVDIVQQNKLTVKLISIL